MKLCGGVEGGIEQTGPAWNLKKLNRKCQATAKVFLMLPGPPCPCPTGKSNTKQQWTWKEWILTEQTIAFCVFYIVIFLSLSLKISFQLLRTSCKLFVTSCRIMRPFPVEYVSTSCRISAHFL